MEKVQRSVSVVSKLTRASRSSLCGSLELSLAKHPQNFLLLPNSMRSKPARICRILWNKRNTLVSDSQLAFEMQRNRRLLALLKYFFTILLSDQIFTLLGDPVGLFECTSVSPLNTSICVFNKIYNRHFQPSRRNDEAILMLDYTAGIFSSNKLDRVW